MYILIQSLSEKSPNMEFFQAVNISENTLCRIRKPWYELFYMVYWMHKYTVECTIAVATGKRD